MNMETSMIILAIMMLGMLCVPVGLAILGRLTEERLTNLIIVVAVMALFIMTIDMKGG